MATKYALICFGGYSGRSVNFSATTDVGTSADHGLSTGWRLVSNETNRGLVAGTTYYVNRIDSANIYLYDTFENAVAGGTTGRIDITTAGTVVLKSPLVYYPATELAEYGLSDLSRWYDGSNHLIYHSWQNVQSVLLDMMLPGDDWIVEVAEPLYDFNSASVSIGSGNADSILMVSKINGKRTPAFHFGVVGAGYTKACSTQPAMNINFGATVDGISFTKTGTSNTSYAAASVGDRGTIRNCIAYNTSTADCPGFAVSRGGALIGSIAVGWTGADYGGIYLNSADNAVVAHNLATKNTVGINSNSTSGTFVFNNVSIGNSLNWGRAPIYSTGIMRGNIGDTNDRDSVTANVGTTTMTVTPSVTLTTVLATNRRVMFETTGSLPTVGGVPLDPNRAYYIRSFSGNNIGIGLIYNGGLLTFDGAGTGTHKIKYVWETYEPCTAFIDFTDPDLVFRDWANNDFRPAGVGPVPAAEAKMVDYAVSTSLAVVNTDIVDAERPNYNNGGYEAKDAGPFEYDHGYGPRPASFTLTLTNVVVGSRVIVRDVADTVTHYNEIASSSSVVINVNLYGDSRDNWLVKVRKGSELPYYRPWDTLITAFEGSQSIYVSQIPD